MTHRIIPADAVGYIARRNDRPERLALFRPDGTLSNSFSSNEGLDAIRAALAAQGLAVDAAGIVRTA